MTRGLLDIEDRRLAVEDEGSGPAVLMLHGLGGTTSVFQVQAEALSSAYRVLRVDFRGAGRSPVGNGVSIAGHVDDALGVLNSLGIAEVTVVAHSIGTVIARFIAARRPDLVTGLALLAPTRAPLPAAVKERQRNRALRLRAGGTAAIVDEVLRDAVGRTTREQHPVRAAFVRELVLRQDPEGFARNYEAAAAVEDPGGLPSGLPVLLMGGEEDELGSVDIAAGLEATSSTARAVTAPQSGHSISIEAPEYTTTTLNDFLLAVNGDAGRLAGGDVPGAA
ncbi:MAG TPA: alpha/beta hydrolase [Solirubrobacteraceae bacterium]|nr:alpha/beta hydrolase [Solirubrobacteraceae bacterium]